MSRDRPTMAELRGRALKDRSDEIGNWLARKIGRPAALPGTWLAVRMGLRADHVTTAALLATLAGAVALGSGGRWGFVTGVVLAQLAFWLDHVDGQVARWRGTASLDGVYFDYMTHHAASLALGFGAGYGLAARTGVLAYALAGFAAGAGWVLLSLHNDCRYKAFFQRLKSTRESYRVDGGGGGRPAPPAKWPRRGWAALSWPAYKICEPHAVLIELSLLGLLAWLWPAAWRTAWPAWIVAHALLAPMLAALRAARSIGRGGVEAEFNRWFRPSGDWTADPGTCITKDEAGRPWDGNSPRSRPDCGGAWTSHDQPFAREPEPSSAAARRP